MALIRHESAGILSKAVEANGFVFTAGIVADNPNEDAKGQTRQILAEIDRLLALSGSVRGNIVQATIWLSDIRFRDAMNEIWSQWTGGHDLPARACIEAKLADPRMQVEISVVAVK